MELLSLKNWRRFSRGIYNKVFDTDVFGYSAQVAFYFSFSFFPLLFFLVTLFGIVLESTDGLRTELYVYLSRIMPRTAFTLVQQTLDEIVENSSGGKLTLGILITLWSASAGVDSLRNSLNAVYEKREGRAWWTTKLQSLVLTFLFIILIAVVIAGVTAGWRLVQIAFDSVGIEVTSPLVLVSVQWLSLFFVLLFVTAVIYSWLPAFKQFRWTWITPGSVVAILLWIILTGAFRLYLQYFNTYNKTYGSLGAVIILMLWMYLTAVALLLGGAINSVLTEMSEEDEERNLAPVVKKAT